ncbi:MAG: hypothetical protein Q9214_006355 [Letrouitia sp. 1 TL-2023]
MCFARLETNIQCGHNKIVITEECQFGATDQKNNCSGQVLVVEHESYITKPRLCVHCYRRKEHDICLGYQRAINDLESAIRETRAKISNETNRSSLDRLKATATRMEVDRGDLVDERYEALNAFRIEQGVWGDG